jgi:NADH:ubiquinone oxidoreductase subunit 2 (subunit N)
LMYPALAMPFILCAGWLLPGVEASPGDLALAVQSAIMLGLGFAFLLAVFPLYSWIPMLSEESSPYVLGFILWILPTMTMLFCMGFLDRYSWLRNSPAIPQVLRVAGLLMVTTGGIWAAFQRHLGRMMGYAAIVETGFYLLALSLLPDTGVEVAVRLILPRSLGLAIWALALATLKTRAEDLRYASLQGALRLYPVASAGLVLAQFSAVGLPLTAGFPVHLALMDDLARQSLATTVWTLIGILGLLIGAMRTLAVLVMAPEDAPWERNETLTQTILLGIGILIIFILGLFPGLFQPFFKYLPVMFEHLGL